MVGVFRIFTFFVVVSVLSSYFDGLEGVLEEIFRELVSFVNEFFEIAVAAILILLSLMLKFRHIYSITLKLTFAVFSVIFAVVGGILVFEVLAFGLILLFFGVLLALIADGM